MGAYKPNHTIISSSIKGEHLGCIIYSIKFIYFYILSLLDISYDFCLYLEMFFWASGPISY
jgi:hypothetical protein